MPIGTHSRTGSLGDGWWASQRAGCDQGRLPGREFDDSGLVALAVAARSLPPVRANTGRDVRHLWLSTVAACAA